MFELLVTTIGTVYTGRDERVAHNLFEQYVHDEEDGYGRAQGAAVVLFMDGEIVEEHEPTHELEEA